MSSYVVSEVEERVVVCVTVVGGELDTNITLLLGTVSGTAEGE